MNKNIRIGQREINTESPAFIIAELSCNHMQDFDVAVKSLHAMKKAGADAVKIQTVNPDTITINSEKDFFVIKGNTLWDDRRLYDLYKEAYTPWEWHKPLQEIAGELGLIFFSSPFDNDATDLLDAMDIPVFKIASFEITDIPFIRHTARKGKPVIISTGIATSHDIADAVDACLQEGNDQVMLMKCTSAYPTPWNAVNLNAIATLRDRFDCLVGLSDHTMGYIAPLGAVALGAKLIEKHFILDRKMPSADAAFSMLPEEFAEMVENIRTLEQAMGGRELPEDAATIANRQFSRSLFAFEDISAGEVLTIKNVRSVRPGYGLPPKQLYNIVGKRAIKNIEKGTPLSWDLIGD